MSGSKKQSDFCQIRIVNAGIRPVNITNIGWEAGLFKNKIYIIQMLGFPGFDNVPKKLQEGEEATFMIPFNLNGNGDDWIIRFPQTVTEKSPKSINRIKAVVFTSIGHSFKVKVEKNLIKKLKESLKANH